MDPPIPSESSPEAAALREEAKPLLRALMADLTGTLAWRRQIAEQIVNDWAAQVAGWEQTPAEYALGVTEGIQQYLHDTFVDTSWPSCPEHPHHPLWLHLMPDGSLKWQCDRGTWALPLGALTPTDPEAPQLPELAELPDDSD